MTDPVYLSIVCVSRNDDHGGSLLQRMQLFLDSLAKQFSDSGVVAELVLVEWNPPSHATKLTEALDWNAFRSNSLHVRVIEISEEIHRAFGVPEGLPLLQMIGKNVGIQRARGEFILCTNIDVLFSSTLVRSITSGQLRPDRMYRAERVDVHTDVLRTAFPSVEEFCWKNVVRRNKRTFPIRLSEAASRGDLRQLFKHARRSLSFEIESLAEATLTVAKSSVAPGLLFTNACGDFTLLHRDGWRKIGGYAEFVGYSFNIDSLGCYAAHYAGVLESSFVSPAVCFHIEHATGSGWTPEGEAALFRRLAARGLRWPSWDQFMPVVHRMRAASNGVMFNDDSWGLRDLELPEWRLGLRGRWEVVSPGGDLRSAPLAGRKVSALKEGWSLSGGPPQSVDPVGLSRRSESSGRATWRLLVTRAKYVGFRLLCRFVPSVADWLYVRMS